MIAALALAVLAAAPAQYKLRPGAGGKLCLSCHQAFEQTLKRQYVHTPLKTGECIGCHNPHASQHGKLLAEDANAVCATCHSSVVPKAPKSAHKPASAGACLECHEPHASATKALLRKPGSQGCASCHQGVVEAAAKARVPHAPANQSCTICHDPHGSARNENLLTAAEPALCLTCHKRLDARVHKGYPVAKASCTGCHDPHGSDRKGMLYPTVHKPVANGQCSACHAPPNAKDALQARASGMAICKDCHSVQVANMMDKSSVHWAIGDKTSCLNCHTPHASRERALLSGKLTQVCGACHHDTIARGEQSPTKHPPVRDGDCASCHDPHSSDAPNLMKKASVVQICEKCHDYSKHSTHPMGEKLRDGRNRNLGVDCLSCHRAHGTEYKHMQVYPTSMELCTKCHEQYKR